MWGRAATRRAVSRAAGPDKRMMPTPPAAGPVAIAAMVRTNLRLRLAAAAGRAARGLFHRRLVVGDVALDVLVIELQVAQHARVDAFESRRVFGVAQAKAHLQHRRA